ncbi:MAG: MFS transporter, partial [Acidobacteria bacterium]|nr:MFS transporter [Acidobacteriota bacterium]
MSRLYKFSLLATLYFSQGLPFGFFKTFLPYVMRDQGASLVGIGLAHLLSLPWALKFLWAPLLDRYGSARLGHRRGWILLLQASSALVLLCLAWMGEVSLKALLWGFVLTNLLAATQDIASDGLAVLVLNSEERGVGNGIQVAAYRLGMIGGGGLILLLLPHWGQARIFLAVALMILAASIPVFFCREPVVAISKDTNWLGDLREALVRPGILRWLAVLVLLKFGDEMTSAMLVPFLKDQGLSIDQVGTLIGTIGSALGMAGALFAGWLMVRLNRWWTCVVLCFAQAFACLVYLIPGEWVWGGFASLTGFEHFIGGMATTAIFTLMMDVSRREAPGTDYTLQASAVIL